MRSESLTLCGDEVRDDRRMQDGLYVQEVSGNHVLQHVCLISLYLGHGRTADLLWTLAGEVLVQDIGSKARELEERSDTDTGTHRWRIHDNGSRR